MSTAETTDTPSGLLLRFYPPEWSDEELDLIAAWGRKAYEASPRLGAWLDDMAATEQMRRLRAVSGELIEVQPVLLPCCQWTNAELSQAVHASTALSYAVSDPVVGQLFDKIVPAINSAVAARLQRTNQ